MAFWPAERLGVFDGLAAVASLPVALRLPGLGTALSTSIDLACVLETLTPVTPLSGTLVGFGSVACEGGAGAGLTAVLIGVACLGLAALLLFGSTGIQ